MLPCRTSALLAVVLSLPPACWAQTAPVYAGGPDVYKSTDTAGTWRPANIFGSDPLAGAVYQISRELEKGVLAIAVDPKTPSTVYASVSPNGVGAVLKTTDAGAVWKSVGVGVRVVLRLAIDPQDPNVLYAGTMGDGVFKSTDGAASWKPTQFARGVVSGLAIDPAKPSTVYAVAGDRALYQTVDGGGTWRNLGPIYDFPYPPIYAVTWLAVSPADSSVVFAAAGLLYEDATPPMPPRVVETCGIYRSDNAGQSWRKLSAPGCFNHLAFDPANPGTLYAGGVGDSQLAGHVVKTTDGGGSWSVINSGLTSKQVLAVAVDPAAPATLYAAAQGAAPLFKSVDGGSTWKPATAGLAGTSFRSVAMGGGAIPTPPRPSASAAGTVNAASFLSGAVAPGEMLTIFGANLGPSQLATLELTPSGLVATSLAQTRVLFDGMAGPLVYVRSDQISAVVPYSVAGKASVQLELEYRGMKSNPVALSVQDAVPALFSANSSGAGQAAALNEDGSTNSAAQPAQPGSVVVLFGTGEGQTDPPGSDGKLAAAPLPKPILPLLLTIGGLPAEILYCGAAPGLVAGVFQVNARVPAGLPPGPQEVILTVGAHSSRPGVTVAIGSPKGL